MPDIPMLGMPGSEAFFKAAGYGTEDPLSAFGNNAMDAAMNIIQMRRQREMEELQKQKLMQSMDLANKELDMKGKELEENRKWREMQQENLSDYRNQTLQLRDRALTEKQAKEAEGAATKAAKEKADLSEKQNAKAAKIYLNKYLSLYKTNPEKAQKLKDEIDSKNPWVYGYVSFPGMENKNEDKNVELKARLIASERWQKMSLAQKKLTGITKNDLIDQAKAELLGITTGEQQKQSVNQPTQSTGLSGGALGGVGQFVNQERPDLQQNNLNALLQTLSIQQRKIFEDYRKNRPDIDPLVLLNKIKGIK